MRRLWIGLALLLVTAAPSAAHPGVGLVRDRQGNVLVELMGSQSIIRKRSSEGRLTTLAPQARFGFPVNWLTVAADGSVYVADGQDVRRIDPSGKISTVAHALSRSRKDPWLGGMSIDPRGNLYVAIYSDSSVVRVCLPAARLRPWRARPLPGLPPASSSHPTATCGSWSTR